LAIFCEWLSSFEADAWNAQIKRGISASKLDKLNPEKIEEFEAGY